MLFNQEEFEHKIEESKLEKGLKLFVNNKIELLNRTENNSFTFLIHEKISGELSLHLKAGKILSYTCYCENKKYCEHLAGVNFYLQQEILKFTKLKRKKRESKNLPVKNAIFQKYFSSIRNIVRPYVSISKLKQAQILDIIKLLNFEQSGASTFKEHFYFHLVVISELPKLSNFTFSETENEIESLVKNSFRETETYFAKGLTNHEKQAFLEATFNSVRSQTSFRTGVFSYLIPRVLSFIKNVEDIETIKNRLKKRKQNKNSLDAIDRKLIAELQLSILQAKLKDKTYSVKNHEGTIELPVALAQLEFCKKKNEKGFKYLEHAAEKIKELNLNKYIDLVDEILIYAREYNNTGLEIKYLEEKFISGFVVAEKDLQRFIDMGDNLETNINRLLARIRSESVFYNFEKLAVVLLHQNRLNELINEIKKEKNKFRLLNKIVIQKLPEHTPDVLDLYIKHFLQAITEAKFPYFQEEIINLAVQYLRALPADVKKRTIEIIKEKLLYERHALSYISKLYPDKN